MTCNEVPNGTSFEVRDYTFPFRKFSDIFIRYANPGFESADILCGISNVETKLRTKFVNEVYELMMEPVVESVFTEPTKYITNSAPGNNIYGNKPSTYITNSTPGNTIKIQLPITTANGPIRQILFFIRRNANIQQFNDWNNYSALTETEIDPVWNPIRPLLTHAQLMVGTAVWADQPEKWWRATCNISLPGGIRAYGNYIYGYNFAHNPAEFGPTGTLNGDRVDIRLNLTVAPPGGSADREWSVSVFVVGVNWMRFQNSIANLLFME